MIYIRADIAGVIELVSIYENVNTVVYEGEVTEDFLMYFGTGKYFFLNGEIILNENWIKPIESNF